LKKAKNGRPTGPGVVSLALIAAGLGVATQARGEIVVALSSINEVAQFDSTNPGTMLTTAVISGIQPGETILGIDFRSANAQLYALGSSNRLYTIVPSTGVATQVGSGTFATPLSGTDFGFDFNPAADRVRVTSTTGQNLRINPDTGAIAAVDTALSFVDGTPGSPRSVGVAYTNSFFGAPAGRLTTMYVLDSDLDALARQGSVNSSPVSPNSGQQTVVGPLNAGLGTTDLTGFDISGATGTAFASLTSPGAGVASSNFFTIDLASGQASFVGTITWPQTIRDIAVVVPAPGPVSAIGLGLLATMRRRRVN